MYILVDTNVFVDYLLKRQGFEDAKLFFELSYQLRNKLFVSSMSIRDIGYLIHREFHSEDIARKAQDNIISICHKVIDITPDDVFNSLYDYDGDFEDALLRESAERNMLDIIVTNNIKDFRKLGFASLTPKEMNSIYLKAIEEKHI